MSTDDQDARPAFYTVAETARLLRVDTATIYRALRDGAFPAIRLRTRYLHPRGRPRSADHPGSRVRRLRGRRGDGRAASTGPRSSPADRAHRSRWSAMNEPCKKHEEMAAELDELAAVPTEVLAEWVTAAGRCLWETTFGEPPEGRARTTRIGSWRTSCAPGARCGRSAWSSSCVSPENRRSVCGARSTRMTAGPAQVVGVAPP